MQNRERLLIVALSLSLALHAAAFTQVKRQGQSPLPLPSLLEVRLEMPAAPSTVPPLQPAAAPARHAVASPPRRTEQAPVLAVAERGVQEAPAVPASNPVPVPAPAAVVADTVPVVAPPIPASESPDPDTLARYGRALSEQLARFQRYPRIAQMRGWQGKVQLRLYVARKGQITSMEILQSSGHESLDQQALEMARQAGALPAVPAALREREFTVVVPIVFSLRETS